MVALLLVVRVSAPRPRRLGVSGDARPEVTFVPGARRAALKPGPGGYGCQHEQLLDLCAVSSALFRVFRSVLRICPLSLISLILRNFYVTANP